MPTFFVTGDGFSGKTCLMHHFIGEPAYTGRTRIGISLVAVKTTLNEVDVVYVARPLSLSVGLLRCSAGAITYDIQRRDIFESVPHVLTLIRSKVKPDVPITLVGVQIRLHDSRNVTFDEAAKYAADNGLLFCEVNAESGEGMSQFWHTMTERFYRTKMDIDALVSQFVRGSSAVLQVAATVESVSSWCLAIDFATTISRDDALFTGEVRDSATLPYYEVAKLQYVLISMIATVQTTKEANSVHLWCSAVCGIAAYAVHVQSKGMLQCDVIRDALVKVAPLATTARSAQEWLRAVDSIAVDDDTRRSFCTRCSFVRHCL